LPLLEGGQRAPVHAAEIDGRLIVLVGVVVDRVGQIDFTDDVIGQGQRIIAHVADEAVEDRMPPQFRAAVESEVIRCDKE